MYFIPILGIIGIFFFPVIMIILIVWFITNANVKRNRLQADLIAKAIDNGRELPENFFHQEKKKRNPLNTGIICMAIGIGVSLFLFLAKGDIKSASLGVVPFFIGLGYFLIWFIGKKQSEKQDVE